MPLIITRGKPGRREVPESLAVPSPAPEPSVPQRSVNLPAPAPVASKTFLCILCKDVVPLTVGDEVQFKTHMIAEHRVFYEFDILLAINLISTEGKAKIVANIKQNQNKQNAEDFVKKETLKDKYGVTDKKHCQNCSCFKEYTCDKCSQTFTKFYLYKIHIKKKRSCVKPTEQNYECEKCGKLFSKLRTFQAHCARTKSCMVQKFQCEKCKKIFNNQLTYKSHTKRVISCIKTSKYCENCRRTFHTSTSMKQHIENKDKACIKRELCGSCGKLVKVTLYDSHVTKCELLIDCSKCGEKLPKNRLRAHTEQCSINSLKQTEQPKCNYCGRIFYNKKYLKRHIDRLNGSCAMKFSCENCGNVFIGSTNLKMHKQSSKKCKIIDIDNTS